MPKRRHPPVNGCRCRSPAAGPKSERANEERADEGECGSHCDGVRNAPGCRGPGRSSPADCVVGLGHRLGRVHLSLRCWALACCRCSPIFLIDFLDNIFLRIKREMKNSFNGRLPPHGIHGFFRQAGALPALAISAWLPAHGVLEHVPPRSDRRILGAEHPPAGERIPGQFGEDVEARRVAVDCFGKSAAEQV